MDEMAEIPEAFVYMKVGNHAGEGFDAILERKKRERDRTGRMFWGYGGTACHPLMQVQPFARLYTKNEGKIYLMMEPVNSRADPDVEPAKEYSSDGSVWQAIPEGICVTGSRYALVLEDLCPIDIEIPLDQYTIGVGPSRGKAAIEYLQGRVDKGCLVRSLGVQPSDDKTAKKRLRFAAKLLDPYAVLLR